MYIKYDTHAVNLTTTACIPLDDPDMLAWEAGGGVYTTEQQLDDSCNAKKFLNDTDWKVIRHRDQLDAGGVTSLTPAEYTALIQERQTKRDQVLGE